MFFNYFLNLILEYCPKKYEIKTGINEKAIFFSKKPYSENATNIEAEIIIKIKSNSLFFIGLYFMKSNEIILDCKN